MEHEFWSKRWAKGQLGFHEGRANRRLEAHIARLETKRPLRILVPLAGKAFDLRWLARRGHEVVGVEFVPEAIRAFFTEQRWLPQFDEVGGMPSSSAGGVTLLCGDIFGISPDTLGRFDVIYDRAALVALDPKARARYVALCHSMVEDGGVIFLIAFAYDQGKASGPPWSVNAEHVRALYTHARPSVSVELLSNEPSPAGSRFVSAGISQFEESAYLIAK